MSERTDWTDRRLDDLALGQREFRRESNEQHRVLGVTVAELAKATDEKLDAVAAASKKDAADILKSIAADRTARSATIQKYVLTGVLPVLCVVLGKLLI